MTYEEKITEIGDYDVIIRTPIDITNETKQEEFKFLAEKLRNILKQIELHEDYESLLADKKRMQEENTQLKELLKECREYVAEWFADRTDVPFRQDKPRECVKKIDQVLGDK